MNEVNSVDSQAAAGEVQTNVVDDEKQPVENASVEQSSASQPAPTDKTADAPEGGNVPVENGRGPSERMVNSVSDERTINNVMRHAYRVLSDAEKAQMQAVKDKGLELHELLSSIGASRELSLAKTKIEEAVMWAVKHITF